MHRDEAIRQNHGFIASRIALASALEFSERPDEAHDAVGSAIASTEYRGSLRMLFFPSAPPAKRAICTACAYF